MKSIILLALFLIIPVHCEDVGFKEIVNLISELVASDLAKEWTEKLGENFSSIASGAKIAALYAGPVGQILCFIIALIEGPKQEDHSVKNSIHAVEKKLILLDQRLLKSTSKILAELKFQNFLIFKEELAALKQHFESIIAGFSSNSRLLIEQLDKFIHEYRIKGSDTKLVAILNSGDGIVDSIVDSLIESCRMYSNSFQGAPKSSTMKTIYEVYMTALITIIEGNLIVESAINTIEKVSKKSREEDRKYHQHRKNDVLNTFYHSLHKTFDKFNDKDMNGFFELPISGEYKYVKEMKHIDMKIILMERPTLKWVPFRYQKRITLHDAPFQTQLKNFQQQSDVPVKECPIKNSVNSIYIGKVSAPNGYVVTGIRIVMQNYVIYPQIQVGKLLPLAMIDQSSVHWQENSEDGNLKTFNFAKLIKDGCVLFNFDEPSFMKFSDSAVTGVQFCDIPLGVSWSIYGKKLSFDNQTIGEGAEEKQITSRPRTAYDVYNKQSGLARKQAQYETKFGCLNFGFHDDWDPIVELYQEHYIQHIRFLPYFDGSDVSFDVKSPLSGITFMHYTNDIKYAGFIRPIIRNFNYRQLYGFDDVRMGKKNVEK